MEIYAHIMDEAYLPRIGVWAHADIGVAHGNCVDIGTLALAKKLREYFGDECIEYTGQHFTDILLDVATSTMLGAAGLEAALHDMGVPTVSHV